MSQLELFSPHREPLAPAPAPRQTTGEQLKRQGIARAVEAKQDPVAYAREVACDVARGVLPHADGEKRADGLCTADDVAAVLEAEGKPSLGNAAGGLFQSEAWAWTGQYVKSRRTHAHQNLLKLWRYRGSGG